MAPDDRGGERVPLQLEGELTIAQAGAVREHMLAWLPQADGAVDASRISACDSTGVQLLLALRRSLQERQQSLELHNPSPTVREVLQRYGLNDITII
jgi:anti-anti-sigma factor